MKKTAEDTIILSCHLIDRLMRDTGREWPDLISLYAFYYRTARHQKTNCPWAVNKFVAKGMHWGMRQVKARKSHLEKLGLIENIARKGEDGKIVGWYVKVNYIWKQTTCTPEEPVVDPTTSTFLHPVVSDSQMLKVQEGKCLKSEEKVERGKRKETTTLNLTEKSGGTKTKESSLQVMTREIYITEITEVWQYICGQECKHILAADLASNSRRIDWRRQADYWLKRLDSVTDGNLDKSQIEAWKFIDKYLGKYYHTNGSYPDMRKFLSNWRAIDWQTEKTKVIAFCKTHDADIVMQNYIGSRAEEGREIRAKWLLSSGDYQQWFIRLNNGAGNADAWENSPSAGPSSFEDLEEQRTNAENQMQQKRRSELGMNLIKRARTLIQGDDASKSHVIEILHNYRDGIITVEELKVQIEALEYPQDGPVTSELVVKEVGLTPIQQPGPAMLMTHAAENPKGILARYPRRTTPEDRHEPAISH